MYDRYIVKIYITETYLFKYIENFNHQKLKVFR